MQDGDQTMNSILYVGLDVQTTNYTICTYEPEYDRILLLESFLPCLLLFFFDIKHSPYVDNVFISCLLNKCRHAVGICEKAFLNAFSVKITDFDNSIHWNACLLCEAFAQQVQGFCSKYRKNLAL